MPAQPSSSIEMPPAVPAEAPEFVQTVLAPIIAGDGDLVPVSKFPCDGTFPTATSQWGKAQHRPRDPRVGSRGLHPVRQVRHRLPARLDPNEGVRREPDGRARPPRSRQLRFAARTLARARWCRSRRLPKIAPAAACALRFARPRTSAKPAARRSTWRPSLRCARASARITSSSWACPSLIALNLI